MKHNSKKHGIIYVLLKNADYQGFINIFVI